MNFPLDHRLWRMRGWWWCIMHTVYISHYCNHEHVACKDIFMYLSIRRRAFDFRWDAAKSLMTLAVRANNTHCARSWKLWTSSFNFSVSEYNGLIVINDGSVHTPRTAFTCFFRPAPLRVLHLDLNSKFKFFDCNAETDTLTNGSFLGMLKTTQYFSKLSLDHIVSIRKSVNTSCRCWGWNRLSF